MKKLLKWIFILGLIAALLGACAAAGVFYYFSRDLPEILHRKDFNPPQVTRVYSSDNQLIGEFFTPGAKRTVVPLEQIPMFVRQAYMAAEDADFMTHQGINYLGWIRALYYAVVYDVGLKGTSTITQQVVKNLILTPERSFERKIKEVMLARELERNLSKNDILYLYLNTIYMGHGVNGVYEAADLYFGKKPKDLTIAEAALLAGLTQSPEGHTPYRHPESALKRRHYVLDQMWKKGFINEATYREQDVAPLKLADPKTHNVYLGKAPFFVEYVRKFLVDRYGKEKTYEGGLRVYTTLDLQKQAEAEAAVRSGLISFDRRHRYYEPQKTSDPEDAIAVMDKVEKDIKISGLNKNTFYRVVVTKVEDGKVHVMLGHHKAILEYSPASRILHKGKDLPPEDLFKPNQVWFAHLVSELNAKPLVVRLPDGAQSALVSMTPDDRHVVALVGSYDYDDNKYDHATQMTRQTGSSYKPIVYASALEAKVITPATILLDSPAVFAEANGKKWSPRNSDGKWRGPIRVREGLGGSRNVIAVRVLKEVGIGAAIKFARRVGVKGKITEGYTMAMGSSELTPLEMVNVYATFASGGYYADPLFVTKVESNRGEVETFTNTKTRVISPEVAYLITSLMTSVVDGYIDSDGKHRNGTASLISKLGRPVAGKTGTTNQARDAWFIGFTPSLVTGVWTGFDDNHPLGKGEYGGKASAPIWLDYMKEVTKNTPVEDFPIPQTGITTAIIDPATGKLARDPSTGITEYFLSGTEPTDYSGAEGKGTNTDFLMNQFGE